EAIAGDLADVGIIVVGGLTNGVLRALARLDLADLYGASHIPIYVLNVAFPLVPEELREFCAGKRAVLVVEEGSPDYIEQAVNVELRRAAIATRVLGKGMLPRAGEYTSEVLLKAVASFRAEARPARIDADAIAARAKNMLAHKATAMAAVGDIPARPPNFCTGCPERPVFSAIKLMQRELGPTHISADIGCHSFATFALSAWAIPTSAIACRTRARPRSPPTWTAARSPSWATAGSGTTASSPASPRTCSTRATAC